MSSLAGRGHRTLVLELINALRDVNRDDIKDGCAGVIPDRDHDFQREAGGTEIFGPESNVIDSAGSKLPCMMGLKYDRY